MLQYRVAQSDWSATIAIPILEVVKIARRCDICGKSPMSGHNVSHSKVRTNRRFKPNLQPANLVIKGRPLKARVCTRCLRSYSHRSI